ncbi:MAG: hypothetical protein OK455_03960 [Thaumarchaeota archaeon]|nr:hypothetical protein [Nitrososphaerota archaeon]
MAHVRVKGGGALGESELVRFREEASSLSAKLAESTSSAQPPDDTAIWKVYAKTEKLIAVLKFRIEYEAPGRFAKLPATSEEKKLLEDALRSLAMSAEDISSHRLKEAVESLRDARNNLRAYLILKRKSSLKAHRDARKKSASKVA